MAKKVKGNKKKEEEYSKKTCSISQETPLKLEEELKGSKTTTFEELCLNYYEKSKGMLKMVDKSLDEKKFSDLIQEFKDKRSISLENEALESSINESFETYYKTIEKDEKIKILTQNSVSYLVEGSLLAIRHLITKKDFEELTKDYNPKAISDNGLDHIRTYYNEITNLFPKTEEIEEK